MTTRPSIFTATYRAAMAAEQQRTSGTNRHKRRALALREAYRTAPDAEAREQIAADYYAMRERECRR